MNREYACEKCNRVYANAHFGDKCSCGGWLRPTCEMKNCHKPSCGKSIYGLGYLVTVCKEHYDIATQQDKDDAIRFRYVEG